MIKQICTKPYSWRVGMIFYNGYCNQNAFVYLDVEWHFLGHMRRSQYFFSLDEWPLHPHFDFVLSSPKRVEQGKDALFQTLFQKTFQKSASSGHYESKWVWRACTTLGDFSMQLHLSFFATRADRNIGSR